MTGKLTDVKARLLALQNRLSDLDQKDLAGEMDEGRIFRMRSAIEQEMFTLLEQVGREIDDVEIANVFSEIRNEPNNAKTKIEHIAEQRGWSDVKRILRENKGPILSLIVTVAIKIIEHYI